VDLILDTNALSAVAEDAPGVARVLKVAASVAIPVVVLGEYRFGIAQSRRRSEYERWLESSLPAYRIFEIDQQTAVCYAELRVELKLAGGPIPSNDVWIGALCRQYNLPLLSRDRHFDRIRGLKRITW
jgi:tRNA(fMet)-specific endonuclease VapC